MCCPNSALPTHVKGDELTLSSILEPSPLTTNWIGNESGIVIEIEAEGLRQICDENIANNYPIVKEVSKTLRVE